MRIAGNSYTQIEAGKPLAWRSFIVRPRRSPKEIDLTDDDGRIWRAIYSLKDDTLHIAFGMQDPLAPKGSKPAPDRPQSFDGKMESTERVAVLLLIWKKVRSATDKK
jgi:uncharacterized protein (TIGR03067 family)